MLWPMVPSSPLQKLAGVGSLRSVPTPIPAATNDQGKVSSARMAYPLFASDGSSKLQPAKIQIFRNFFIIPLLSPYSFSKQVHQEEAKVPEELPIKAVRGGSRSCRDEQQSTQKQRAIRESVERSKDSVRSQESSFKIRRLDKPGEQIQLFT